MKKLLIVLAVVLLLLPAVSAFAQKADWRDCKDHSLFPTRMPGYYIADCKAEEFGVYEFWTENARKKIPVEGKFTYIAYAIQDSKAEPSAVAVVRNYENAIRTAGGTILQKNPKWWVNGKIVKNGAEAWVQAEKGNGRIWLRIIEKKAMEQHVTADAASLGNDLKSTGRAALYGILFDTGKSTILPESSAAIGEIAKLMKTDPGLKLGVVGHTDNVGGIDSNIKLSQDRAAAVVKSLVQNHGIAAARLKPFGCGLFAPVASNDTEEGRAKNRRVEIVNLTSAK